MTGVPEGLEEAERVPVATDRVQVTPRCAPSFATVGVKERVPTPAVMDCVDAGERETERAGDVAMVMTEVSVFVGSVTLVAVRVTVAGDGTDAGAVYVTPVPEGTVPLPSTTDMTLEHQVPLPVVQEGVRVEVVELRSYAEDCTRVKGAAIADGVPVDGEITASVNPLPVGVIAGPTGFVVRAPFDVCWNWAVNVDGDSETS